MDDKLVFNVVVEILYQHFKYLAVPTKHVYRYFTINQCCPSICLSLNVIVAPDRLMRSLHIEYV